MFQGVLIKTSYELPGSNKFLFSPIFLVITSPHFVIGGFPGHHLRPAEVIWLKNHDCDADMNKAI